MHQCRGQSLAAIDHVQGETYEFCLNTSSYTTRMEVPYQQQRLDLELAWIRMVEHSLRGMYPAKRPYGTSTPDQGRPWQPYHGQFDYILHEALN